MKSFHVYFDKECKLPFSTQLCKRDISIFFKGRKEWIWLIVFRWKFRKIQANAYAMKWNMNSFYLKTSLCFFYRWQCSMQGLFTYDLIILKRWYLKLHIKKHSEKYIFNSFQIEWNMIVVRVLISTWISFGSKWRGELPPRSYFIQLKKANGNLFF